MRYLRYVQDTLVATFTKEPVVRGPAVSIDLRVTSFDDAADYISRYVGSEVVVQGKLMKGDSFSESALEGREVSVDQALKFVDFEASLLGAGLSFVHLCDVVYSKGRRGYVLVGDHKPLDKRLLADVVRLYFEPVLEF